MHPKSQVDVCLRRLCEHTQRAGVDAQFRVIGSTLGVETAPKKAVIYITCQRNNDGHSSKCVSRKHLKGFALCGADRSPTIGTASFIRSSRLYRGFATRRHLRLPT